MKNWSLATQIWLFFASLIVAISLLLYPLIPFTLKNFFTNEIYSTIENAQSIFRPGEITRWLSDLTPQERDEQRQNIRTVRHVVILNDGNVFPPNRFPIQFLKNARQQAKEQKEPIQRYSQNIKGERILYVIRLVELRGQLISLISYMWDSYRNDLVTTLFRQLAGIMILVFLVSWIPSFLLARYLTRPLVLLEKHVQKITKRDWKDSVVLNRGDEIGKLAHSIEAMRVQLIHNDELQQSFLQNISHALKTPVMVIRSYAQSILDSIFPQGNLESSVKVIQEEAERLEKRNRDLLYLTKLDYLSSREPVREQFDLSELISSVADRFRIQRPELQWSLSFSPCPLLSDREQWMMAIENLLDNQIRYAVHTVSLTLQINSFSTIVLRIGNDGPAIEARLLPHLFQAFHHGQKGEFGLGLSIVKRIITLQGGTIEARNEENGVTFILHIPIHHG